MNLTKRERIDEMKVFAPRTGNSAVKTRGVNVKAVLLAE